MSQYVDVFRDLDEKRQGLDFEIHELLEDIDTQATFEGQNPASASFESDSKVGMLINKMVER